MLVHALARSSPFLTLTRGGVKGGEGAAACTRTLRILISLVGGEGGRGGRGFAPFIFSSSPPNLLHSLPFPTSRISVTPESSVSSLRTLSMRFSFISSFPITGLRCPERTRLLFVASPPFPLLPPSFASSPIPTLPLFCKLASRPPCLSPSSSHALLLSSLSGEA